MLTANLVFIELLCFCKKSIGVLILYTNDFVLYNDDVFLSLGNCRLS